MHGFLRKHEWLAALLLVIIVALLVIVSSDTAPQWIYQGF